MKRHFCIIRIHINSRIGGKQHFFFMGKIATRLIININTCPWHGNLQNININRSADIGLSLVQRLGNCHAWV